MLKRPIFPVKTSVGSKVDLFMHIKQNKKYTQRMKIEAEFLKYTKSTKQLLRTFKGKSKVLTELDLIDFTSQNFTKGKLLKMIKHFHRIKSLILFWVHIEIALVKANIMWLKYTNMLNSLILSYPPQKSVMMAPTFLDSSNIELIQAIKKTRLKKCSLSLQTCPKEGGYGPIMNKYPFTVSELSILSERDTMSLQNITLYQEKISLAHMINLCKLELLFPLNMELLIGLLQSIPYANKLACLGLFIPDKSLTDHDNKFIRDFLQKCSRIKNLRLSFLTWPSFIENLAPNLLLESLNLDLQIHNEEQFLVLAAFIEGLENLQQLELWITVQRTQEDSFEKVYNREFLSKLKKLKKLSLKYVDEGCNFNLMKPLLQISSISKLLKESVYLEELKIHFTERENTDELHCLVESLENKASQLKKLEINFKYQYIKADDLQDFINFLDKTSSLEEFTLNKLRVTNLNCLESLKKVLVDSKQLRNVSLNDISVPTGCGLSLISMIKSLLCKPKLENFSFEVSPLDSMPWTEIEYDEKLYLPELIERNPSLKNVSVSYYLIFQGLSSEIRAIRWE